MPQPHMGQHRRASGLDYKTWMQPGVQKTTLKYTVKGKWQDHLSKEGR